MTGGHHWTKGEGNFDTFTHRARELILVQSPENNIISFQLRLLNSPNFSKNVFAFVFAADGAW